jgi:predicted enzyme related to lactoylglutathione lyase
MTMATTTQHAPGTFCWPELATTDQNGAKKFYSALFGWTPKDTDMGNGEFYTIFTLNGRDVAATYTMRSEQRSQGIPPNWMSYVATDDTDQTAKRVKELGGQVLMEPFDVYDMGRMAIFQDPTGAVFSAWQAKKSQGVAVLNEPGALCWTELITTDVDKSRRFYTSLLPWSPEEMNVTGTPYTVFKQGTTPAAGMMARTPEMGDVPPHWMPYLAVTDVDAIAAKTRSLGGKVLAGPMDIPGIGRFAVLQDPQGAAFSILAETRK